MAKKPALVMQTGSREGGSALAMETGTGRECPTDGNRVGVKANPSQGTECTLHRNCLELHQGVCRERRSLLLH